MTNWTVPKFAIVVQAGKDPFMVVKIKQVYKPLLSLENNKTEIKASRNTKTRREFVCRHLLAAFI